MVTTRMCVMYFFMPFAHVCEWGKILSLLVVMVYHLMLVLLRLRVGLGMRRLMIRCRRPRRGK